MSFVSEQRAQQIEHFAKFDPALLMEGWPYRLQSAQRAHNLAPSIRVLAVEYFEHYQIQWHRHANHALSSQVCCLNFFMPLARKKDTLALLVQRALGGDLPHMLPVEKMPDGTELYVGFEWIGGDYLNESGGRDRSRGANATSADAVVMFERNGQRETLLIEWKYTESYGAGTSRSGNDTRRARYASLTFGDEGPLRADRDLKLEDFFFEPFYQLLRQQILACQMERHQEDGAKRVSVLHISPSGNAALHKVTSPTLRRFGADAFTVWSQLLVDPSRFKGISTEALFGPLTAAATPKDAEWSEYLTQRYLFLPRL